MMPKKTRGVHRWIAIATYPVTEEEVEQAKNGGSQVMLTPERVVGVDVGCIDCEEPYGDHSAICTGREYKGFDRD